MGTTVKEKRATKRRKQYKIPFSDEGHMLHHADEYGSYGWNKTCVWKEPAEFQDTLMFLNFEKGNRSGAWAWYESVLTGTQYCVTLGELATFIKNSVTSGVVTGIFDFVKRGQNYSLTFVRSIFEVEKINICIPEEA